LETREDYQQVGVFQRFSARDVAGFALGDGAGFGVDAEQHRAGEALVLS